MSNVLISFIGTGATAASGHLIREYRTAEYVFENPSFRKRTSFITSAIAEYSQCDKIIVLGTSKSMWEEYYRYFSEASQNFDEDLYFQLGQFSEQANHLTNEFPFTEKIQESLPGTMLVILKYGLNESELRFNLEQILKIDDWLNDHDRVFVDVTHGFRSFPLFAQQIILYLKQVSQKKIEIEKFFYGMLDATRDLGYTPVIDLSIIQRMNDLILGAGLLINKSDGSLLVSLLKNTDKKLATLVDNFSKALNINYSHEVKKQYERIIKYDFSQLSSLEKTLVIKAFDEFKLHFSDMNTSHSLYQLDLAHWYFKKKLYGVSYLTLTEAIVTFIAEQIDSGKSLDKDIRDQAKKEMWNINKEVARFYKDVNKIRKNVAHMLEKRHDTFLNDIQNLEKKIDKAYRLIQYNYAETNKA